MSSLTRTLILPAGKLKFGTLQLHLTRGWIFTSLMLTSDDLHTLPWTPVAQNRCLIGHSPLRTAYLLNVTLPAVLSMVHEEALLSSRGPIVGDVGIATRVVSAIGDSYTVPVTNIT